MLEYKSQDYNWLDDLPCDNQTAAKREAQFLSKSGDNFDIGISRFTFFDGCLNFLKQSNCF